MNDKLLCPICGNELEKSYNGGVFCPNLDCELADTILGVEAVKIWTDTKKKLDKAIWWLNEIVENHRFTPISTAEMALKEITALEQKETK